MEHTTSQPVVKCCEHEAAGRQKPGCAMTWPLDCSLMSLMPFKQPAHCFTSHTASGHAHAHVEATHRCGKPEAAKAAAELFEEYEGLFDAGVRRWRCWISSSWTSWRFNYRGLGIVSMAIWLSVFGGIDMQLLKDFGDDVCWTVHPCSSMFILRWVKHGKTHFGFKMSKEEQELFC